MVANGPESLEFIIANVNKLQYLQVLKNNLRNLSCKLELPSLLFFQHDNDAKHTVYVIREWLLHNSPILLKTPSHSLQLTSMQHL